MEWVNLKNPHKCLANMLKCTSSVKQLNLNAGFGYIYEYKDTIQAFEVEKNDTTSTVHNAKM